MISKSIKGHQVQSFQRFHFQLHTSSSLAMQFLVNLANHSLVVLIFSFLCSFNGANGLTIPEETQKRATEPLTIPFNVIKKTHEIALNETEYLDFLAQLPDHIDKRDAFPVTIYNNVSFYAADVYFGTPQQKVSCDIDTGSSDLYVLTNTGKCTSEECTSDNRYFPYQSSTYSNRSLPFHIVYGDKSRTDGVMATDSFSFIPGKSQLSGATFFAGSRTSAVNCLLGIAKNTQESEYSFYQYDNIPSRLAKDGVIPKASYSIYLNNPQAASGTLLFGGYDKAKIDGAFPKLPISTPAYSAVNLISFQIDGQEDVAVNDNAVLDTGTTITLFRRPTWEKLGTVLPNAVLVRSSSDNSTYYAAPFATFQNKKITYKFDGVNIAINLEDLILPVGQGYYVLNIGISPVPQVDILGDTFLTHAYVYFDLTDDTISLGNVKYTDETNIVSD